MLLKQHLGSLKQGSRFGLISQPRLHRMDALHNNFWWLILTRQAWFDSLLPKNLAGLGEPTKARSDWVS